MKLYLTNFEISALLTEDIHFDRKREYTEDEALQLLDEVRNAEVKYSQCYTADKEKRFSLYGKIGDKIFSQIPADDNI